MTAETNAAGADALAALFGVDPSRSDDVAGEAEINAAHAAAVDALLGEPESAPVDWLTEAQKALEKAEASGDPKDLEMARALSTRAAQRDYTGPKPNPSQGRTPTPPPRTAEDAFTEALKGAGFGETISATQAFNGF